MKRVLPLMVSLALCLSATPGNAVSDVQAVGQGSGTITFASSTGPGNVVCSASLTVTFVVRNSEALLTESWGPGTPTGADCTGLPVIAEYPGQNVVPQVQQCFTEPLPSPLPSHFEFSIVPGYTLSQSSTIYTLKGTLRSCYQNMTIVDTVSVNVRSTQLLYSHIQTATTSSGTTTDLKASGTLTRTL